MLLGEPGAGKTILLLSFLKKIATKLKNEGSKSLLPLFAPIRRWDRKEDIICWLINQAKVIDSGIDESLLKQKIRNREVLFLLDGLDELPAKDCRIKDPNAKQRDYRLEFMQKFADFESKYGQNPTIITCRNRDYQNIINKNGSQKLNLNGAVILKQLNYKEIKNYLEYSFAADSQFFRDIWTTLIQNSVLRTMVRTPFLLTVLISPYKNNHQQKNHELEQLSKISSTEELFDNFIIKSYEREQEKQDSSAAISFDLDELKQILGQISVLVMSDEHPDDNYISLHIFNQLLPQNKVGEFINLCQNLYLLIKSVTTEQNTYRFCHLLLREYFAFRYIDMFLNHDVDNKKLITKEKVAIALGKLNKLRATDLLIDLLGDSDKDVRYQAAKSLGELKAGVYFRGYKQDFSEPNLISKSLSKFEEITNESSPKEEEIPISKPARLEEEQTPISEPVLNHENNHPDADIKKTPPNTPIDAQNLLLLPISEKTVWTFAAVFCFLLVLVGFLLGLLVKSS